MVGEPRFGDEFFGLDRDLVAGDKSVGKEPTSTELARQLSVQNWEQLVNIATCVYYDLWGGVADESAEELGRAMDSANKAQLLSTLTTISEKFPNELKKVLVELEDTLQPIDEAAPQDTLISEQQMLQTISLCEPGVLIAMADALIPQIKDGDHRNDLRKALDVAISGGIQQLTKELIIAAKMSDLKPQMQAIFTQFDKEIRQSITSTELTRRFSRGSATRLTAIANSAAAELSERLKNASEEEKFDIRIFLDRVRIAISSADRAELYSALEILSKKFPAELKIAVDIFEGQLQAEAIRARELGEYVKNSYGPGIQRLFLTILRNNLKPADRRLIETATAALDSYNPDQVSQVLTEVMPLETGESYAGMLNWIAGLVQPIEPSSFTINLQNSILKPFSHTIEDLKIMLDAVNSFLAMGNYLTKDFSYDELGGNIAPSSKMRELKLKIGRSSPDIEQLVYAGIRYAVQQKAAQQS